MDSDSQVEENVEGSQGDDAGENTEGNQRDSQAKPSDSQLLKLKEALPKFVSETQLFRPSAVVAQPVAVPEGEEEKKVKKCVRRNFAVLDYNPSDAIPRTVAAVMRVITILEYRAEKKSDTEWSTELVQRLLRQEGLPCSKIGGNKQTYQKGFLFASSMAAKPGMNWKGDDIPLPAKLRSKEQYEWLTWQNDRVVKLKPFVELEAEDYEKCDPNMPKEKIEM